MDGLRNHENLLGALQGALAPRDMPTLGRKRLNQCKPCETTIMPSFMWIGEVQKQT